MVHLLPKNVGILGVLGKSTARRHGEKKKLNLNQGEELKQWDHLN